MVVDSMSRTMEAQRVFGRQESLWGIVQRRAVMTLVNICEQDTWFLGRGDKQVGGCRRCCDLGDAGTLAPRVLVEADWSKWVLGKRNRVPSDLSPQPPPVRRGRREHAQGEERLCVEECCWSLSPAVCCGLERGGAV